MIITTEINRTENEIQSVLIVYSLRKREIFFVAGVNAWCPDRHTIGHVAQSEVFPNHRIYRLESFVGYVIVFFFFFFSKSIAHSGHA